MDAENAAFELLNLDINILVVFTLSSFTQMSALIRLASVRYA